MTKKFSTLFILLFCGSLFGMQNNDFFLATKKKRKKKEPFLTFLEQNVQTGLYKKEEKQKKSIYYTKKDADTNVQIETVIDAYQKIQGLKTISLVTTDIPTDCNHIASMKYLISNNICTISLIQTDPEFQRQGFGSLLLTDLEQELRQSGCKAISLIALDSAEGFYDKHGFITENAFGRKTKKLD